MNKQTTLLGGPYAPPAVPTGDRASCLYRDCDVVVTSWTDAPLPWPRCQPLHRRGGCGLLMTEELVRAIRTESALALKHWLGISDHTVWCWRKGFGVGRWGTEGSRQLHHALSEAGTDKVRGKPVPRSVIQKHVATRKARGVPPPKRWAKDGWTPSQLALLGTVQDDEVAGRIGRTPDAVRIKRTRRRIPTFRDGRFRE